MDIQVVNLSSPLRVYYKAQDLASGQNVIFNIWDDQGTQLFSNVPADGEVGGRGVYYLDITTPSAETYLLVKGSLATGKNPSASVYSIGIPDKKVWYVQGGFKENRAIAYEIFDINASREVSNEILEEAAGGFYYADVSAIESGLPLFFRVGDLVFEFDLLEVAISTSGGIVVGGLVSQEVIFQEIFTGGVTIDGAAVISSGIIAAGGIVIGGSATIPQIDAIVDGGVVVGGEIIEAKTSTEIASGTVVCSGIASVQLIANTISSGGVIVSGDSEVGRTITPLSVGGIVISGAAIIDFVSETGLTGGVLCSGIAEVQFVGNVDSFGGVVVGGFTFSEETGGVLCSGIADVQLIVNVVGDSGVVCDSDDTEVKATINYVVGQYFTDYKSLVLLDSPHHYWRLSEETGKAINCGSVGALTDGVYDPSVTRSVHPIAASTDLDRASRFNGQGGVYIPDHSQLNLDISNAMSVEAWFNVSDSTARQVVWEQGGFNNGLNIYVDNGQVYMGAWSFNSGWGDWSGLNAPIQAGKNYHAVIVYDGDNTEVRAYLNGALIGVAPAGSTLYGHTGNPAIGMFENQTNFHDTDATGDGAKFVGVIDEVAVYFNAVLPEESIFAHWVAGDSWYGINSNGRGIEFAVYNISSLGGVTIAGQASEKKITTEVGVGGIVVAGDPELLFIYNINSLGGIVVAGESIEVATYNIGLLGGIVVSGTAIEEKTSTEIAIGGIVLSGQATEDKTSTEIAAGGIVLNGTASVVVTYSLETLGGVVLAGEAVDHVGDEEEGEGGILVGGSSVEFAVYKLGVAGGILVSGEALDLVGDQEESLGGIVVGGQTAPYYITEVLLTGGTVVGGESVVDVVYSATGIGGAVTSGEAEEAFVYELLAIGGIAVSGEAEDSTIVPVFGGIVVSGEASVEATYTQDAFGGIVVNGDYRNTFYDTATGGIVVAGEALEVFADLVEVSGGVVVGGSAIVEILHTRFYRFNVGETVYFKGDRNGVFPPRYTPHTVCGIRIFGQHELYDIGLGILVDNSFLIDQSNFLQDRSSELKTSCDLIEDTIDDIGRITPLADPFGGTATIIDVCSAGSQDLTAKPKAKSNRLKAIVPKPTPVGGIVRLSETTAGINTDTSSINSKLNRLKKITTIPNPKGGSISVTDRMGGRQELVAGISKKLDALRNTSALPSPTGGAVKFTQTSGETNRISLTSERAKLNDLENVAVLPDPTGAYIIVSMETEKGDNTFNLVNEHVKNRLNKLLGV